jgi:hypothetical protein
LDKIKEFISEIESPGFKLKLLKTDNGGEYVNDEVNNYAKGVPYKLSNIKTSNKSGNMLLDRFVTGFVTRFESPKRTSNKTSSTSVQAFF